VAVIGTGATAIQAIPEIAKEAEFPNMIMLAGPQIAATNFPRAIEPAVDWATDLLDHVWATGHNRFDTDPAAEQGWVEDVARATAWSCRAGPRAGSRATTRT